MKAKEISWIKILAAFIVFISLFAAFIPVVIAIGNLILDSINYLF